MNSQLIATCRLRRVPTSH